MIRQQLQSTTAKGYDLNSHQRTEDEAYEPPAVVEVGTVSSLTGSDGSQDNPDDLDDN
jgi:hypothetical protein